MQVILLGLYNGQRLYREPSRDIVTYARSVEVWLAVLLPTQRLRLLMIA